MTESLQARYERLCGEPSDINEHLPTLRAWAVECDHVTEFGVRAGVSTTALLAARPSRLVCYDLKRHPEVDTLAALAKEGGTDFTFHAADVLEVEIEPTDLLFVDTMHNAFHLSAVLARHAAKVRRHIAIHDTETFGWAGDRPGSLGLLVAIADFLKDRRWVVKAVHHNNNGLFVMERA